MNVVLISRTESKLASVQKELEEATGKEFKTVAIDFGKFDEGSQQRMMNVCKDLDVGNGVYSFPYLCFVSQGLFFPEKEFLKR